MAHIPSLASGESCDTLVVTLCNAKILILGHGNIAKALTPHLVSLGASVKGAARSYRVVDGSEVRTKNSLANLLPWADVIVMILLGSPSTEHALNAKRLKLMQRHAWVVDVGRGLSIDEEALANAIEKDEISDATLDVFEIKPLPPGSRMWKMGNIIIKPDVAGGGA